jgi:centrosomal protein CEP350
MQKFKKREGGGGGGGSQASSPDSSEANDVPTTTAKSEKNNNKNHHYQKKLSLTTDDEMMNDELEKSFRQLLPSESHLKRSKQETNKDSLDMSSFLAGPDTSMQQLQSHLQQNHQSNARFFEDDSFKKFTGEIVKKYMQEEELRSKHQAHLLKLREKALIEKTDAELAWLEQMKKKAQVKGEDEKMPSILSKQKGIMQKVSQKKIYLNLILVFF